MEKIAQKFLENQNLNKEEFVKLIRCAHDPEVRELLAERALELRKKYYGDKVYGRGNYALGIKEQLIFPEIEYDKVDKVRGMDIIFVTTAKTDEEARYLLSLFNMPFAK